jgi:dynein heavy chain 2
VPIIREWKDMLSKVSDNQALLSSLRESRWADRFLQQIAQF